MSIDTLAANVYTTLSTHAGLIALVSTRIYPVVSGHAGTSPFVVYQQVAETQYNVLNNAGGGGKRKVHKQY